MEQIVQERPARIAGLAYNYASQPKFRRERCNLCSHDRFVRLTHSDRYGFPAVAEGCLQCGLVFLNPVMTTAAYGEFYASVYRPLVSAYHGRVIDAQTIQAEQVSYAEDLANFLAPHAEGLGLRTLLDIGGSTGIVAHHIGQRFGLSGCVLDPAPLEIEVAARLGLRTVQGFVEDFEPGEERFDLIMICQTVDHLLDVRSALTKVCALMHTDALLFVDIVDFRAAYLRNWSVEGAIKIDHPFYLTEETMYLYLRRVGLEVLAINYAPDHLHIGFLCRAGEPQPAALPSNESVAHLWREIREVQNRHRG